VPGLFDHVFAITLAVLFPIRAALFGYRRLTDASPDDVPRVRLWLYKQGIAIQWALTALCIALWVWKGRSWPLLGVVPRFTWGLIGVAVGFTIVAIYILSQRRKALADEETLARLRRQMQNLERMLPRSERELRWFERLSITAGVCEELLYRGYLIWYVSSWIGVVPAALVASVIFGFGHAYQGPRGILVTSVVGVFMSAVYLVTGSLVASMVIHALMDIYSGHTARAAFLAEGAVDSDPPPAPAVPVGTAES
jgi:membrane protease YdiL (CAAX protease family)